MAKPAAYASVATLDEFLKIMLKAYPDVTVAIANMTDGSSDPYKGFHHFTTTSKITTVNIRQYGIVYQVNRSSNIRDTSGYERYVTAVVDDIEMQHDETVVTYRLFDDMWHPWVTIPL